MGDRVDIGKQVNYKTLETALIEAAKEVGWKARIKDEFERNYKLGPAQKTQDYSHTMINLRGKVFPAMRIFIPDKNRNSSDSFFVWRGFPHGMASEKKVQKYLGAVSERL